MATTASQQISNLASTIGTDARQIIANIGDLSALTTTQKTSLVLALNELKAALNDIDLTAIIDDSQTVANLTWSSSQISSAISTAVNNLINGAPETLDTLKEVADAIDANQDAIAALQSIASGHVKYDGAQTLTTDQQTQARTNIDAVSTAQLNAVSTVATNAKNKADANATNIGTLASLNTTAKTSLVAAINEANSTANSAYSTANSADTKVNNLQTEVTNFKTAVGDTGVNYVNIYTAARDGTSS